MKDTIRILLGWRCNLSCAYCCNERPQFRDQIKPVRLNDIDFAQYKVVCITGGEPLLFMDRLHDVCVRVPSHRLVVLYTNGVRLDRQHAERLAWEGVNAINVGLHVPQTFDWLIQRVTRATKGLGMSVRFHVQDIHTDLADRYPDTQFRTWKLDDCDRDNEERVILQWD
jgi:molybdenum cofactor biosynthesis enzyme MoaA